MFKSVSSFSSGVWLGLIVLPWGLLSTALATVDLDGNHASEFWELRYPGYAPDDSDPDHDGHSNWAEMIFGTDPGDASDGLNPSLIRGESGEVEILWEAKPGKLYHIERLDGSTGEWEQVLAVTPAVSIEVMGVMIPEASSEGVFRLSARDFDGDQDGVNAWEEFLLGWGDDSPNGSGSTTAMDYEEAIRALESPTGASLVTGETLATRLPTEGEASRFLVQTSFGPTLETINEVTALGMHQFVDQQIDLPVTLTGTSMWRTGMPTSATLWRHGWWRSALVAPDQLRQRMAYALSQILVVNTEVGTVVGDNVLTQVAYYDPFVKEGFGTYRGLINHITYSPAMGFYLSHLKNRKSDPATNRFPDENFAREIMQLFTIGLWKLNPDGSLKTDPEGHYIPTYDNSVITEMAKIFTGMSNGTTNRGQTATSFYDSATGSDYIKPMIVWDEEHEPGDKTLFNGIVIPSGQTGDADVQQALDALCAHENMAPFISRLLIQRLTSSNPSPGYLSRVSYAWTTGGGNLERVMRAIIFDPEARTRDDGEGIRGLLREPLIRMTHIMRSFALPDPASGKYGVLEPLLKSEFNQYAGSSPSVFNFYLPDHSPLGLLHDLGLVSPEFQIATTSALLGTHDRLKSTAMGGHWVRAIDYTEELAMLSNPQMLIDHLDKLLTYGTMSSQTRAAALDRILREPATVDKVKVAVHVIVTSPEFSVLK